MLNSLRQRELGLPFDRHDIACKLIGGSVEKTAFTEKEIDAFAVKGVFLALLNNFELKVWDHTRNVVLWTQNVHRIAEYNPELSLQFMGESLVYTLCENNSRFVQIFNLAGIQIANFTFPRGFFAVSNDKIFYPRSNKVIGGVSLHDTREDTWTIPTQHDGKIDFFESKEFICTLINNNFIIINKISHETRTIQLDEEDFPFKCVPLADTLFVFSKDCFNEEYSSPNFIVELSQAQIINPAAFQKSGPIDTLIHHEGWTYVADRFGSLVAYHLNGTSLKLQEALSTEYDCRTTFTIDNNFLVSYQRKFFQGAIISIWSTVTKKLLGSLPSEDGRAIAYNGKIFSSTYNGFETFDLYKKNLNLSE